MVLYFLDSDQDRVCGSSFHLLRFLETDPWVSKMACLQVKNQGSCCNLDQNCHHKRCRCARRSGSEARDISQKTRVDNHLWLPQSLLVTNFAAEDGHASCWSNSLLVCLLSNLWHHQHHDPPEAPQLLDTCTDIPAWKSFWWEDVRRQPLLMLDVFCF